jgi:hypothetical protein
MIDFWSGLGVGLLALLGAAVIARAQIKAARSDAEREREDAKLAREDAQRERSLARGDSIRESAADILERMSHELEGMAHEFRADRVPYASGHAFKSSIDAYKAVLRPFLVQSFDKELERMEDLAARAVRLDEGMRVSFTFPEPPDALAADCERAAGDLRGRAMAIRTAIPTLN